MLVGRLRPVARISFWNELEFATFTGTGAESVELPAASRARAVNVCAPFETVRVSHASAYGGAASSTPALTPSTRNCTPATPMSSLASAVTFTMSRHLRVARGRGDRNRRGCRVAGASGDGGVHVRLDLGRVSVPGCRCGRRRCDRCD